MIHRLVLTLATAASLFGLYAVYKFAMRPVIEIPTPTKPPIQAPSKTDYEPPDENRRVALKYLPEWAAKSNLGLHSDQAFVYTNDWKHNENNKKQVQFTPFAMAWLMNDSNGKETAVTIDSDSAVLEFEKDFDEKFGNPGRVVKAMFNDDVHLTGPNDLKITGQNFVFDESTLNLQTSYPLQFRYLSHRGRATHMKMKLIPTPEGPDSDRPRIYGVEWVQLSGGPNRIDPELHFVQLSTQLLRGQEIIPAMVRCSGELIFNVLTNTAVLNTDVRAIMGKKPKFTTLDCNKMTIQLSGKTELAKSDQPIEQPTPQQDRPPTSGKYQTINRDLTFDWLVAEGLRQDDLVKINSAEFGIVAKMTRLTYRAATRHVSMISEHPERQYVEVDRHGSQLYAPAIDITYHADNSLNTLMCQGMGAFKFFDAQTKTVNLVATWRKQFSMKKDDATDLHLVELEEKAQFQRPGQGTKLGADLIKIWLAKLDFNVDTSKSDSAKTDDEKNPVPEPKQLRAEGSVAMISPKMVIKRTNELDILFEESAEQNLTTANSASQTSTRSTGMKNINNGRIIAPQISTKSAAKKRTSSLATRQVGFANVPAEDNRSRGPADDKPSKREPSSQNHESNPEKAVQQPIHVRADRIRAQMRRDVGTEKIEPREVQAEGHVEITQEGKLGEQALRLNGDIIDMHSEAEGEGIVHVLGKPAIIRNPKFNLEGKDLNFDRGENRVWVRGAGVMKLPIPEEANLPGLEAAVDRDLHVRWRESMEFDGVQAKFVGLVESELGLFKVRCEQMTVQLANRLSFGAQADVSDAKPTMKTIRCQENVTFENSRYERNIVMDVYRGFVGELLVNHMTGMVEAVGPGKVRVWQRKAKDGDNLATQDTIQANRPIPTEVTAWNYTRIEFEGQLKGRVDMKGAAENASRRFTVEDRVEVIHGPVAGPNEEVDPDRLPSMGGTMRCEQLQTVSHPTSKEHPKGYFVLIGLGNTEVEGRVEKERFTAQADEISYDESKALFTLRAHGKRNAKINGMVNQNGQRIEFIPKTKQFLINGATETRAAQ